MIVASAALLSTNAARGQCEYEKLIAVGGGPNEWFGMQMAVSDDVLVIGAPRHDDAGGAFVYRFDGAHWVWEQTLSASDGAAGDEFGDGVAIDGDVIVVGALASGPVGADTGAAYVFRHDGTTWVEEDKLLADDGAHNDAFGQTVAVSGHRIVVTAWGDDDLGSGSGSAYVFTYNSVDWDQSQKLTASDGGSIDWFGWSMALDGDRIVVGAPRENAPDVNSGAAYVFQYNSTTGLWEESTKLTASDGAAEDSFGESVAVRDERVLVGAYRHDAAGVDGGAAYVYEHDGSGWNETKLLPAGAAPGGRIGASVALSDTHALLGAHLDDENASGAGAAYLYEYTEGVVGWSLVDKLLPADPNEQDNFGFAVALDGDMALVGAWWDDDNGVNSGSAYVFAGLMLGDDCNGNGVNDLCDIAAAPEIDANDNGVPDSCEAACPSDLNGDGATNVDDLLQMLTAWGDNPGHPADLNGDGSVNVLDLLVLLGAWGPC